MRCRIVRAEDNYELNIRDTDAIGETEGFTDEQIDAMEDVLKREGRFWLDATRIVFPIRYKGAP